MVFSDTTNKNGLIQTIEEYSNLSDGAITSDDTLLKKTTARVNDTLSEIITEIMMAQDNFDWDDPTRSDFPIATTPLVAGQRDYQFDNLSFLKLKRLDVAYDGVNYYRGVPFDSASYQDGLGNDSLVDNKFNKADPHYDPKAFGFWLYPRATAADVAAGGLIRVEFTRSFDPFTYDDTVKEPPIDSPFHELIAIGAALKYAVIKDEKKAVNLNTLWQTGLKKLGEYYGKRDEDFNLTLNPQLERYT